MKPENLLTNIFLDSGDPHKTERLSEPCEDTKQVLEHCGFLDGQTTNPSLVAQNPETKERIEKGEMFTRDELLSFYKNIVQDISEFIPNGSVSIEVYADSESTADDMVEQAREMDSWITNAHIKLPIIPEGLKAARQAIDEGMRVNMTLCFSQAQAAAVYNATEGASAGDVFVSPFVGRLDDQGENGMDLIRNILKMYEQGDGHVQVLTASVRSLDHFKAAIKAGTDIITAPFDVLKEWADQGMPVPDERFGYDESDLQPIPYTEMDLEQSWVEYDISHPKTDEGIEQFAQDWNALLRHSAS